MVWMHSPEDRDQAARRPQPAAVRPPTAVDAFMSLQRAVGNRALAGLLAADAEIVGRWTQPTLADLPRRDRVPEQTTNSPTVTSSAGRPSIQRDLAQSMPVKTGVFEIDMIAHNDAVTGAGQSGLKGGINFEPASTAPYTNKLGLVQIIKVTDAGGTDINIASMPATAAPHLRTKADPLAGVEGGFHTDVLHQNFGVTPPAVAPKGQPHASYYEGGAPIFGFRRSEKAEDIKAAKITDFPGTTGTNDLNFRFETVAKGDDNQLNYGAIHWEFKLRGGKVQDEHVSVTDDASATYDAALGLHEDFYVHEPVTIYFDFNADTPAAGEDAKLSALLPYLAKFPDVRIKAEGFADLRGSVDVNKKLSRRRAQSTIDALVSLGIDASRIDPPVASGLTSSFTSDAITAQDEEANRRGNRRVMLTFSHTVSTP
jgi:outer membrane protein OmpA-like peptidoglycan-associated protein